MSDGRDIDSDDDGPTPPTRRDDTVPIEVHVDALMDRLRNRADAMQKLSARYSLTIVCVVYECMSSGMHLSSAVLQEAARLGLGFRLHGYHIDDHGHDLWSA